MRESSRIYSIGTLFHALALVFGVGLFVVGGTVLADEKPPEVTHDGLHLVPDSEVAVAYTKPDADFSIYDRVLILDCFVAFKKNWQRDMNRGIRATGNRITDQDMERIKTDLADLFREVFTEQITEGGYDVVEQPAGDVLLIRPAIIDLDINAPDTNDASRSYTFTSSAGAATLFIELYDSVSGEILARAVDRKSDRGYGNMTWSNRVSNSAEARRMLRGWADLLVDGLDEVHGKNGD